MTTTPKTGPQTYKAALLRTVSRQVLQGFVSWGGPRPNSLALNKPALQTPLPQTTRRKAPLSWVGLLARMRLWLSLVFKPSGEADISAYMAGDDGAPLNRRAARAAHREVPLAHRSYALGHILLRRYGFSRFKQWLYKFGLIGRLRFCFVTGRSLFWGLLWAGCVAAILAGHSVVMGSKCAAPLSPD